MTTKQTAKDKGVPEKYLNPATGRFLVGRDATYKRDLIADALAFEEANGGKKSSPAHKQLQRMSWTSHLDASRKVRAAKAAKKAKRTDNGKVDSAKTE